MLTVSDKRQRPSSGLAGMMWFGPGTGWELEPAADIDWESIGGRSISPLEGTIARVVHYDRKL